MNGLSMNGSSMNGSSTGEEVKPINLSTESNRQRYEWLLMYYE